MVWPKGKQRSIETRLKMSKHGLPETRETCVCGKKKYMRSKMCKDCFNSEERSKSLIGVSHGRGVPKSLQHRQKISSANKGISRGKGNLNPNWKGGISTTSHLIRSNQKYRDWQAAVIKSHQHICARCHDSIWKIPRNGYACHHIKAVKILIQEAIATFPDMTPIESCLVYEPLWEVSNGMLLHKQCHIDLHKELKTKVE